MNAQLFVNVGIWNKFIWETAVKSGMRNYRGSFNAVTNSCLESTFQTSTGMESMASAMLGQILQPLSYEAIYGRQVK